VIDTSFFAPFFPDFGATVSIWAPAAVSGGTAGTATQVGTAIRYLIVPASDQGQWGAAPVGMAGERSDFWGFDMDGSANVLPGYEVKVGTATYIVQGTAHWGLGKVAGLSLPH
jgi:hypothetical protein